MNVSPSRLRLHRPCYPKKVFFTERLPMNSKNRIVGEQSRVSGGSCTAELQTLFSCLKKWEFDDVPCQKQHQALMACVARCNEIRAEYKEAVASTGAVGGELTRDRINALLQAFPQPDMGMPPYRKIKRLPTQSYADDLFHNQNKSKKKS